MRASRCAALAPERTGCKGSRGTVVAATQMMLTQRRSARAASARSMRSSAFVKPTSGPSTTTKSSTCCSGSSTGVCCGRVWPARAAPRRRARLTRRSISPPRFGWEPILEKDFIIGAKLDGQSVTLEPGGQFELSGAHLRGSHAVSAPHAANYRRTGRDAAHDVRRGE